MDGSQKDISNSQPVPTDVQEEANSYEDEINLIDYFRAKMADIEENRFSLEPELERRKAILAKLKSLEPEDSGKMPGGIVLQFDNAGRNSECLPLAYQMEAVLVDKQLARLFLLTR